MQEIVSTETLEKMKSDTPLCVYVKKMVGKLAVVVLNPFTLRPEERILQGDPNDPKANKDEMMVKIYDESSHQYFLNSNKKALEEGLIAPYNSELPTVDMTNAITDEEIDDILSQPFYTLKYRLEKFTSSTPIERILLRAIEMNKSVGTVNHIKERLSEMQTSPNDGKKLEEYYKNIQK